MLNKLSVVVVVRDLYIVPVQVCSLLHIQVTVTHIFQKTDILVVYFTYSCMGSLAQQPALEQLPQPHSPPPHTHTTSSAWILLDGIKLGGNWWSQLLSLVGSDLGAAPGSPEADLAMSVRPDFLWCRQRAQATCLGPTKVAWLPQQKDSSELTKHEGLGYTSCVNSTHVFISAGGVEHVFPEGSFPDVASTSLVCGATVPNSAYICSFYKVGLLYLTPNQTKFLKLLQ